MAIFLSSLISQFLLLLHRFSVIGSSISCRYHVRCQSLRIACRFPSSFWDNIHFWKPPWQTKSTGSSVLQNSSANRPISSPIFTPKNFRNQTVSPIYPLVGSTRYPYQIVSMYLSSSNPFSQRITSSSMNLNPAAVHVPIDLCYDATRASQTSLLVRPANPRKQNLRALSRFFPRLWGLDDVVSGRITVHGRVQFLFPSNEALHTVIRRGPWSFNEWMVAMEPWSQNLPNDSPDSINFWVQIRDIPLQFFSAAMVAFIASSIGHVIETDATVLGGNATFARVCFRWPLENPLIFERLFQFGHESATVTFIYERLRNYCFRCHSLQHDKDECEVPDEEVAIGHQEPHEEDDEDDGMAVPIVLNQHFAAHAAIDAVPRTTIIPETQLLLPPPSLNAPVDMVSSSVLLDGRRVLVSDLRGFYHTYTAVADPSEAEARRRRILLSLEHIDPAILHEIVRPLGLPPPPNYPSKKRRYASIEASCKQTRLRKVRRKTFKWLNLKFQQKEAIDCRIKNKESS